MSVVLYIPLSDIRRRGDARAIDPATVEALAESIKKIGLRTPINVRPVGDKNLTGLGIDHQARRFGRVGVGAGDGRSQRR